MHKDGENNGISVQTRKNFYRTEKLFGGIARPFSTLKKCTSHLERFLRVTAKGFMF
jgi:hypothetical protein